MNIASVNPVNFKANNPAKEIRTFAEAYEMIGLKFDDHLVVFPKEHFIGESMEDSRYANIKCNCGSCLDIEG